MNISNISLNRRNFVSASAFMTLGAVFNKSNKEENEGKILPNEDLMREHGILRRIMLIYERSVKLPQVESVEPIKESAKIVRSFIEDYHEKLEENYIFPRFRKEQVMVEMVDILQEQHEVTRKLTDMIMNIGASSDFEKINKAISLFINAYRPHASREDTELFPQFRKITSPKEYDHFGETFEEWEKRLFGENGFENMVNKVEAIEKKIGINLLQKFTPNIS
jgi:hemerythrin-like domain-containing protein